MTLAEEILDAVGSGASGRVVRDVSVATTRQNQLLFFFKPECFLLPDRGRQLELVELGLQTLTDFQTRITGAVVLPGAQLDELSIMDRHYGYINKLSRQASTLLTDDEVTALRQLVGAAEGVSVLGGHEALAKTGFSPEELEALWATKVSKKLRSGMYAEVYQIGGADTLLVNGFHPAQLAHFTGSDRRIALLTVESDLPWQVLRQSMVGDTFPERAAAGSIRRRVFDRAAHFGFTSVSIANNCAHLSAGPFEALFELRNFLADLPAVDVDLEQCREVHHLRAAGWTGSVDSLLSNPAVSVGGTEIPLFDITEGVDGASAAWLATLLPRS